MIKLSKRLQTVHDMVPKSVVADIGADHGKLIISLYEDGLISYGFAVENKIGPYNRLEKAIKDNKLSNYITPIFSSGIKDIPETVNTLVIAGMGGNNIIDILYADQNKLTNVDTLVVDAHSAIPKMRREVIKLGFIIEQEKIIKEDDIYYEIIKFVKNDNANYTDEDYEFGPILRKEKNSIFMEKYQERLKEINNLLSMNIPESRYKDLEEEKKKIEVIL